MRTPTKDSTVFIIEQTPGRVVYETTTGEKWEILGTCNMCGLCEVGGHDSNIVWNQGIEPGQPNACYDANPDRLDNPCRPEIKIHFPTCQLSGTYL